MRDEKGKVVHRAGNSRPQYAAGNLGAFFLLFGWFGFNAVSTLNASDGSIGLIIINTAIAAAAGTVGAMLTSQLTHGKPDASMSLNGLLAGLVGITAGCDAVDPGAALIIGVIAGVVVVVCIEFIDKKLHIDDPVGAIAVHRGLRCNRHSGRRSLCQQQRYQRPVFRRWREFILDSITRHCSHHARHDDPQCDHVPTD